MNNNLNISSKITAFRKEKSATQEQLADYVGVSVAAVSKWETNQSYPDITLLPSIADFFEVSIDSLLDYSITDPAEKLKELHKIAFEASSSGAYNKYLPTILDGLKKYPNDFTLLETAGGLLDNKRYSYDDEESRKKGALQAIQYFEKAIRCAKTEPEKKNIVWVKKNMTSIYSSIGEYETAMGKLLEINQNGAYNAEVADLKYKMGEKKECKKILQHQLWQTAFGFWQITGRLANCYEDEGNLEMSLEAQKFHALFLSAFTWDTPNYADDICAVSYLEAAKYCQKLKKTDEMWKNISKSVYHAVRFDEKPSYKTLDIKFMDEQIGGNMSTSNLNSVSHLILRELRDDFKEFADDERHAEYCGQLDAVKTTKVKAGVWQE